MYFFWDWFFQSLSPLSIVYLPVSREVVDLLSHVDLFLPFGLLGSFHYFTLSPLPVHIYRSSICPLSLYVSSSVPPKDLVSKEVSDVDPLPSEYSFPLCPSWYTKGSSTLQVWDPLRIPVFVWEVKQTPTEGSPEL